MGLEDMSLTEIAEKVCSELPEGWQINICMERNSGLVELIQPIGLALPLDEEDSIQWQALNALSVAIRVEEEAGRLVEAVEDASPVCKTE